MVLLLGLVAIQAVDPRSAGSLLERYCLDCHDGATAKGDVDLSRYTAADSFLKERRLWRRVAEVMEAREMPPAKKHQPDAAERDRMIGWVRAALDNVDWKQVRAPGRVAAARLTREEYRFAVQDLFGVQVELEDLLPDDPEGLNGFANDRASLVMTGQQLERGLQAAERVAATVIDAAFADSKVIRYEVEDGENANWRTRPLKRKDGATGWKLRSALGQKYQSVSRQFDFDRTGEWRVRVRALSDGPGPGAGLWLAVDSVNDATREAGVLVTNREFGVYETRLFVPAGRHELIFGYDFYRPLWLPEIPDRPQMKLGQSTFHPPPYDRTAMMPDGVSADDLARRDLSLPEDRRGRALELLEKINRGYFTAVLDRLMLNKFHYEKGYLPVFIGGFDYDYTEEVLPAMDELGDLSGTDRATLLKIWKESEPPRFAELEATLERQKEAWTRQDKSRKGEVGDLFVDWIELEAMTADPTQLPRSEAEVAAWLGRILPAALRRPVAAAKRDEFAMVYRHERAMGASHRDALFRTLVALLVSPDFLFQTDGAAERAGVQVLDDNALAARLAAFLWSSVPDRELQQWARDGSLDTASQIDRMLENPKSLRLARLFTEQWLDIAGIGRSKEPDKELFRYFSWHLAKDMREEVALVFHRLLQENRSVIELLDSPDSFVNERLARLYGVADVVGEEMRPVVFADHRRGGLLGTAAVLTTTSLATRTSPVRRGQFVLETLLGVKLPPPPANVPDLGDQAGQSPEAPLRDSLARHRRDPACHGCHARIDPLGFALENFDWIGRWRERDPAGPVDARGELKDGRKLAGVVELKRYLVEEGRDDFLRALTERLLSYALGRELEYYDEHALREIVTATKADGYRVRTLIKSVADSYPFRFREVRTEDLVTN